MAGPVDPPSEVDLDGAFYEAVWLSQPIRILGHHQIRIFRFIRAIMRKIGSSSTVRLFWLTEGQAAGAGWIYGDQYKDVDVAEDSEAFTFGGDAETATITITDWTAIPAGTEVYIGILTDGVVTTYMLEEGPFPAFWHATVNNDITALSLRFAIDGLAGVAAAEVGPVVTVTADAGHALAFLAFNDPATDVVPAGIEGDLDEGPEFGTVVFAGELGEQDVATRASVKGTPKGRWIQIGVTNSSAQREFGVRSFQLDTRRTRARR